MITRIGLVSTFDESMEDKGELNFTPTCPRSIYAMQIRAMEDYIAILEARAVMAHIDTECTEVRGQISYDAVYAGEDLSQDVKDFAKSTVEQLSALLNTISTLLGAFFMPFIAGVKER